MKKLLLILLSTIVLIGCSGGTMNGVKNYKIGEAYEFFPVDDLNSFKGNNVEDLFIMLGKPTDKRDNFLIYVYMAKHKKNKLIKTTGGGSYIRKTYSTSSMHAVSFAKFTIKNNVVINIETKNFNNLNSISLVKSFFGEPAVENEDLMIYKRLNTYNNVLAENYLVISKHKQTILFNF